MKKEIKSFGKWPRIIRCLVTLSLCLPLHATGNDLAEFGKAVFDGNVERVRELLNKNPEFLNGNVKDGTPLFAATFLARKEVIELLLSKGADPNLPGHQYFVPKGGGDQMPKPLSVTPLHIAAYQGYADITKILLAAKADPTAKSEDGTTPLHTAAAYGKAEVVKELIAAKADVNTCDMDGATPLHYAADKGIPEIYTLLVPAGANVDIVAQRGPYAGKTPRQMAKENFESARPNPVLIKSIKSMRLLGLALHEFAAKQGSFPNETTAKALEKTFREPVKTNPSSADDYLNQVTLVCSEPASLNACMTGDGADKRWVCSYIPGASPTSKPMRPVALLPLIQGKPLFDTAPLTGKAIILFDDISVHSFPIEPDGRVLIDGLDIFDPKQPFWNNSKPDIKWPRPSEK